MKKREYNLRERAEIVTIAMQCVKTLSAQPLIDYFQMKENQPNADKFVDNCIHYDEAQGRYKCCNPKVKDNKCRGICIHYEEKPQS